MALPDLTRYALIGGFMVLWVAAAVSWGFAAVYMFKTMSRYHPDRAWGKFVPVSLFMPWFFTDEGNRYRIKLLRAAGLFLALVGIAIAFGLVTGALDTSPGKAS
jgi:hypothetical protein